MKFILEITFSGDVLNDAGEIAAVSTKKDADQYLEKLVETALEGGYFKEVIATVIKAQPGA